MGTDPKDLEGWTRLVEVDNRGRAEELKRLFIRRRAVGREMRMVKGKNKDMDTAIWELPRLCVR